MTKVVFIADLHLDDAFPQQYDIFSHFIDACLSAQIDSLFILGDLFDVWVGDDILTYTSVRVAQKLNELAQANIRVYFQHGNRDFMLGETYARKCGMRLLPDRQRITLYDKKVLLMHGDVLCREDRVYQVYRLSIQSSWVKAFIASRSKKWRIKQANSFRQRSIARNSSLTQRIMNVTPEAAETELTRSQATILVHGHTHQPEIVQHSNGLRVVLGAWENDHIQIGISDEQKGVSLRSFSSNASLSLF